ncbi:DUF6776 family protein [Thiocystis violacea]|uniref:DUF6776 family protein n=1 Tax=Thiocystis violacea TaxID=13725 RepID=UPI001907EC82|nr:DUF6776 family protein [Thiocystis violacea]MBK1719011.1 hypothetical protein [Thiocystis violacea]
MSDSPRRLAYRLLAIGVLSLTLAAVFLLGFELGKEAPASGNGPAASDSLRVQLLHERDRLKTLLAESERQRLILDRTLRIDREASRLLKEQIKEAQDARLERNRELNYLKRLVQGGSEGAVQVYDMRLVDGEAPREYRYDFTIMQLIQGFGRSTGEVLLSIEGRRGDAVVTLTLSELPEAQPDALRMDFEHFQNCQGAFVLPHDFDPISIVVDIKPRTERLLPTSVSFPWGAVLD